MRKSILFEGITVTLLILLVFMLIAMIMGTSGERSISGISQDQYIYTGNDGTLYMFLGNDIRAISPQGVELWDFTVPDPWKICNSWHLTPVTQGTDMAVSAYEGNPIAFSENGTLYVYLKPNETYSGSYEHSAIDNHMAEGLVAIYKGKVIWNLPLHSLTLNDTIYTEAVVYYSNGTPVYPLDSLDSYNVTYSDASVYAQGGRIYVYHGYNETVIDANGTILWSIDNVANPVSVDENGYIYCVPARSPDDGYSQPYTDETGFAGVYHSAIDESYNLMGVMLKDYRVPSAIVDAYYPNGTLYWQAYPGSLIYRQFMGDDRLPLYNNGTIYAPLENGIVAYDTEGREKWSKSYDANDFPLPVVDAFNMSRNMPGDFRLYGLMPFDEKGDVYLEYISRDVMPYENTPIPTRYHQLYLMAIGLDGKELSRQMFYTNKYVAAGNGIGYATSDSNINMTWNFHPNLPGNYIASNLSDLSTKSLIAYDMGDGRQLWNYTFPVNSPTITTVDASNAGDIIPFYFIGGYQSSGSGNAIETDVEVPQVISGHGRVYAYFRSTNYDTPLVFGKSRAAFVSGVYALDVNGTLLWNKTISGNAYSMNVVNNSTIFYRTYDGRFVVTGAGAAMGFALTAILYIFLRFFCIGAIARAHSRINKNENRNAVYDFIAKNPGLTLYEISRGLGMNIGTVRYHLFILGMNHRIVPYDGESKFVRYFTNSNSYSREDQAIVSIMRRESYGKVLGFMLARPMASNVEIAMELGIQESVVSRCIKELSEKGIVVKEPSGSRSVYTIDDSHKERVAGAMRRIYGE